MSAPGLCTACRARFATYEVQALVASGGVLASAKTRLCVECEDLERDRIERDEKSTLLSWCRRRLWSPAPMVNL